MPAAAQDPNGDEPIVLQVDVSGATEASVVLTQTVVGNTLTEQDVFHTDSITGSFNNNSGIATINQAAGNMNNQANIYAIALGASGLSDISVDGKFEVRENTLTAVGGARLNVIADSFNDTSGIVSVNQAAGNMNVMANIVVIAMGLTAPAEQFFALSDRTLGEVVADNVVDVDPGIPQENVRTNSFNNFTGVAQVNQVAGDANVSAQVFGLTFSWVASP